MMMNEKNFQFSGLLFCALLACGILTQNPIARASDGEPRVDAQLYFSEKDPHWAEASKVIDEFEKTYPTVKLERISIDTPEGAARLASHTTVVNPGDLTFMFGPYWLTSKGDKRDVEIHVGPMVHRLLHPELGKGRKPTDPGKYAAEIFGQGAVAGFIGKQEQNINYYRIIKDSHSVGFVVDAYRPIGCPICGDVQFLMAVNPAFTVMDLRPVRELERRGRKLEDDETAKFIKQFIRALPMGSEIKVDTISGATRTSLNYEQAMNEIINDLKDIDKNNFDKDRTKKKRNSNDDMPGHD